MPRKLKTKQRAIEMLSRIRARLQQGWIQGPCAVDKYGQAVLVDSKDACGWCLIGSLWAEKRRPGIRAYQIAHSALNQAVEASRFKISHDQGPSLFAARSPINFNETPGRRKRDVLTIVERARQLVRAGKVAS